MKSLMCDVYIVYEISIHYVSSLRETQIKCEYRKILFHSRTKFQRCFRKVGVSKSLIGSLLHCLPSLLEAKACKQDSSRGSGGEGWTFFFHFQDQLSCSTSFYIGRGGSAKNLSIVCQRMGPRPEFKKENLGCKQISAQACGNQGF